VLLSTGTTGLEIGILQFFFLGFDNLPLLRSLNSSSFKRTAGERGSSARASVLNNRRNSVFSDMQESPEKIRDGDNMNNSLRIQFEYSELHQEQFICSSCLSTHHDIEQQSFCIICGWKVCIEYIYV
jgi:hypothetical protein